MERAHAIRISGSDDSAIHYMTLSMLYYYTTREFRAHIDTRVYIMHARADI